MFTPGTEIEISYPESTLIDAVSKLRRRRIHVTKIRDLVAEPLTPQEFLARPFIRRSRWLISGIDLDSHQRRQFYLGSSAEHESPGILRVGLYAPGDRRPRWPFPLQFTETRRDRLMLAKAIDAWLSRDLADLSLRVFVDDFRIVRPPINRSA